MNAEQQIYCDTLPPADQGLYARLIQCGYSYNEGKQGVEVAQASQSHNDKSMEPLTAGLPGAVG